MIGKARRMKLCDQLSDGEICRRKGLATLGHRRCQSTAAYALWLAAKAAFRWKLAAHTAGAARFCLCAAKHA